MLRNLIFIAVAILLFTSHGGQAKRMKSRKKANLEEEDDTSRSQDGASSQDACVQCLAEKECDYCSKQFDCDCDPECDRCLEENDCQYCQDKFECKCRSRDHPDCTKCLNKHACNYCRNRYGCDCDQECDSCLKEHECSYCEQELECKCRPLNGTNCEECLDTKSCSYCNKKYGCECDQKCSDCLAENDCNYCRDEHGCKCHKKNLKKCKSCLKNKECDYCHRRYGCECEYQCADCIEDHDCEYCQKAYGCKCRDLKCERCLQDRECEYCQRRHKCNCGVTTTPAPNLPICKKCFEPRPATNATWSDAVKNCADEGYKLASLRSITDQNSMIDEIVKRNVSRSIDYWLAGSCSNHCWIGNKMAWTWTDSPENDLISKLWENWLTGRPSLNTGTGTNLVTSGAKNFEWKDATASTTNAYICERPCDTPCHGGPKELQSIATKKT